MKVNRSRPAHAGRRGALVGAAVALLAGALVPPVAGAQSVTPGTISDASFVWGVSGYAQKGVFAPWNFVGAQGDAALLPGSVGSGTQTEYTPAAFPATSFPADLAQAGKTPHAVKFTGGEGTREADGTVTIEWDGDFTVNAYGASFGAPNEVFSDPVLELDPSGAAEISFEVSVGAGQDQQGNPTPEVNAGRKTVMTVSPEGYSTSGGVISLVPDFAGVEYHTGQVRTCSGGDVWGSWPAGFVDAVPESVRSHYYSTGCGGLQNSKGALPVQLRYTVTEDAGPQEPVSVPAITVSETALAADGTHQVTVTGRGFDNPSVVGTRPPLAGQPSGAYVVFGRFAQEWKPSTGAPAAGRKIADQKWALPTSSFQTMGGADPYVEIDADGTFTATLTVSKADADALDIVGGNYGIYTYPAGGATEASYELYTPITFTDGQDPGEGDIEDPTEPGNGLSGSLGSLSTLFG